VSSERVATKIDCYAGDEDVHVYMTRAWWVARLPEGTYLELNYDVDLDPARARPRLYQGLGDNSRLSLWFAAQPTGSSAEVHADGLVAAAPLNSEGRADIAGANLNAMLAGASDIEVLLFDAQRNLLRRDLIARADLQAADANLISLTAEVQRRLIAPARRCTPTEHVILPANNNENFEGLFERYRRSPAS
jgi:hypothetical protein